MTCVCLYIYMYIYYTYLQTRKQLLRSGGTRGILTMFKTRVLRGQGSGYFSNISICGLQNSGIGCGRCCSQQLFQNPRMCSESWVIRCPRTPSWLALVLQTHPSQCMPLPGPQNAMWDPKIGRLHVQGGAPQL